MGQQVTGWKLEITLKEWWDAVQKEYICIASHHLVKDLLQAPDTVVSPVESVSAKNLVQRRKRTFNERNLDRNLHIL